MPWLIIGMALQEKQLYNESVCQLVRGTLMSETRSTLDLTGPNSPADISTWFPAVKAPIAILYDVEYSKHMGVHDNAMRYYYDKRCGPLGTMSIKSLHVEPTPHHEVNVLHMALSQAFKYYRKQGVVGGRWSGCSELSTQRLWACEVRNSLLEKRLGCQVMVYIHCPSWAWRESEKEAAIHWQSLSAKCQ